MNKDSVTSRWRLASNSGYQCLLIYGHLHGNEDLFDFQLGMQDACDKNLSPTTSFRCRNVRLPIKNVEGFVRHISALGSHLLLDVFYSEAVLSDEKGFRLKLAVFRDQHTEGANTGLSEIEIFIEHGNAKSQTRFKVDPISVQEFEQEIVSERS